MLKFAVIDDEINHLETTCKMIKKCVSHDDTVDCFESREDFEKFFCNNPSFFDVVLLDICLPKSNGIDIAKLIRQNNDRCRIIYISNYLEFATEVYETEHTFFVLKTEAIEKLPVAIKKAKEQLENIQKESVCFKVIHAVQKVVLFKDIICVERVRRKTIINTVNGTFESLENVNEIFAAFEGERLLRCHRSYWVNPMYVKKILSENIVLTNGKKIPLSRGYNKEMKSKFMHYITLNV